MSARFLGTENVLIKREERIYEVPAARMRKLITARARKNKRTARALANDRKDHSISLILKQWIALKARSDWLVKL